MRHVHCATRACDQPSIVLADQHRSGHAHEVDLISRASWAAFWHRFMTGTLFQPRPRPSPARVPASASALSCARAPAPEPVPSRTCACACATTSENPSKHQLAEAAKSLAKSTQFLKRSTQTLDAIAEVLTCPITTEFMQDPVTCPEGQTFEREAIEAWLKVHETNPSTRNHLTPSMLCPNVALRQISRVLKEQALSAYSLHHSLPKT